MADKLPMRFVALFAHMFEGHKMLWFKKGIIKLSRSTTELPRRQSLVSKREETKSGLICFLKSR